ncbi:MAG: DMT family transporter [Pseudomonadota bacterium]
MPDPSIETSYYEVFRGAWTRWWDGLSSNIRGGLLFILGSLMFTIMIALIKMAGERLHVTEILFFRQLTMTAIAAPVIIAGWPQSVHSARPKLQVLRVIMAFLAMTLGFLAFIKLTMAEATVIAFSKTFFTTILAIIFLGEIVRAPRWIALVLGFIGVGVIVWPDEQFGLNVWHIMSIASAVCVSVVMIIIRILARLDKPVTILTYQAVGVGVLMIPPTIWFWKTPTMTEWLLLFAIGVISAIAQYLNILSFKHGEASALAPLEYTRLIFATLLGLWLFAEWPEQQVWVGAAIIVGAAVYMMHREQRAG